MNGGGSVTFRAQGVGRFFLAAFILVWLAGWAVGEYFAIRGLLWAFRGGTASPAARAIEHPVGWIFAGFIAVWIAGWTAGGIAAFWEVLRLVAGSDQIEVSPEEWRIRRGAGPFGRTRSIPIAQMREVFVDRRTRALMIETETRNIRVTTLGTPEERGAFARRFVSSGTRADLPPSWTKTQKSGAVVLTSGDGCLSPFGSTEWHVRRDSIVQRLRFLTWWRTRVVEPGSLQVEHSTDSDGDDWISLTGSVGGKPMTLMRTLNDERSVLRIARVLEQHSGWSIPLPRDLAEGKKRDGTPTVPLS